MATESLPGRDLEVPTREELIACYEALEARAKQILGIELIATAVLGLFVFFRPPALEPMAAWFCAIFGGLGIFYGFVMQYFLKTKRLHELRDDVRFGVHTKRSLELLVDRVFSRLGLPKDAAPVYVTRAKDVNAFATRRELLPGVHFVNGVYLNRSILHLLDEAELESVVGHELGHVFPYAPLLSRCYLIHAAFSAVGSLWLGGILGQWGFVLFGPVVMVGLIDWIVSRPWARIGRGIEFLCDDFGAQAAGMLPAMSSEMKINAESETRTALLGRVLEAKLNGANTTLARLIEVYDEAVPFGSSDPEAVRGELQRLLATRVKQDSGMSLRGFYEYISEGDGADQQDALKKELRRIQLSANLPVLLADRGPWLQGSAAWTPEHAAALVRAIEATPDAVLFRDASELPDGETTHPGVSRRILFLWKNRHAYELRHESPPKLLT